MRNLAPADVCQVLARPGLPIDTVRLARFLLGKLLIRRTLQGTLTGRIVETEAYPVGDPAGHAHAGRTPRNGALFLSRGHAYVYLAYGTSYLLNVSSEIVGVGAGVLIRALEPVEGVSVMQRNRGLRKVRELMRGPGRLTAALDIDHHLDGIDLCRKGSLCLARDGAVVPEIGVSPRIGLSRAARQPLRFYVRGSPFVSGPKTLNR